MYHWECPQCGQTFTTPKAAADHRVMHSEEDVTRRLKLRREELARELATVAALLVERTGGRAMSNGAQAVDLERLGEALSAFGFETEPTTYFELDSSGEEPKFITREAIEIRKNAGERGEFATSYNGREEHPDFAFALMGLLDELGYTHQRWRHLHDGFVLDAFKENDGVPDWRSQIQVAGDSRTEAAAQAFLRAAHQSGLLQEVRADV